MKAKLEDIPVQNRGVELESETEEEKAISRWCGSADQKG
ncbi:hypothetical protein ES703_48698 [subsurface metagenome]